MNATFCHFAQIYTVTSLALGAVFLLSLFIGRRRSHELH